MKIETKDGDLMLVAGDIHIGRDKLGYSHDPKAIECFLQVCEVEQPEFICLIGDIGEFKNYMRHVKNPDKYCDGQDEIDWIEEFLTDLRFICPDAYIFYVEGNHEDMLRRYILANAPNLAALRCLYVPELLQLSEKDIHWVDHRQHVEMGELTLIHGQFLSGSKSGNAAHKGIIHYGKSYGQGHCHTLAKVYQTKQEGMRVAFETGHLRNVNADYIQKVKPWQQGFASVRFYEHGFFHADVHPVFSKGETYYTMFDKNLYEVTEGRICYE